MLRTVVYRPPADLRQSRLLRSLAHDLGEGLVRTGGIRTARSRPGSHEAEAVEVRVASLGQEQAHRQHEVHHHARRQQPVTLLDPRALRDHFID
ncbi:hypothetical protein GCM10022245_24150 [Streptomyces mayteni]